jgi:hypothetical protein
VRAVPTITNIDAIVMIAEVVLFIFFFSTSNYFL